MAERVDGAGSVVYTALDDRDGGSGGEVVGNVDGGGDGDGVGNENGVGDRTIERAGHGGEVVARAAECVDDVETAMREVWRVETVVRVLEASRWRKGGGAWTAQRAVEMLWRVETKLVGRVEGLDLEAALEMA
ncbi:hypothetical protein EIP86_008299 [Pleurotus ostreatoroseus]|nr:hypothetical protein EIP86_008299 [Pleurotus ostreatoroseus]